LLSGMGVDPAALRLLMEAALAGLQEAVVKPDDPLAAKKEVVCVCVCVCV